jgi:uncharacterized membrane protein
MDNDSNILDTEFKPMGRKPDFIGFGTKMTDWLGLVLLTLIPCVGIILLGIWSFKSENEVKRSYCRAVLAVDCVLILLLIICSILVPVTPLAGI